MQRALVLLTAVVACSCIVLPASKSKVVLPDVETGVIGRWELVTSIEGGGAPIMEAPGRFTIFRVNHTVASDCGLVGASWAVLADGSTIEIHDPVGGLFRYEVIELSATTFAFREDIAEAHYQRRDACP